VADQSYDDGAELDAPQRGGVHGMKGCDRGSLDDDGGCLGKVGYEGAGVLLCNRPTCTQLDVHKRLLTGSHLV